jgi:hypothetical protein
MYVICVEGFEKLSTLSPLYNYVLLLLLLLLLLLFTAIGSAPGGSSPTLVQTKTMKQYYTITTIKYNNTYTSK